MGYEGGRGWSYWGEVEKGLDGVLAPVGAAVTAALIAQRHARVAAAGVGGAADHPGGGGGGQRRETDK